MYRLIDTWKAEYTVTDLVEALDIPRSAYNLWSAEGRLNAENRAAADKAMTEQIRIESIKSDETYGAYKIWNELRLSGVIVSQRRVAELARAADIVGLSGRTPTRQRPGVIDLPHRSRTW